MVPEFVDIGSAWEVLPPGIHEVSMDELDAQFAWNDHRQELLAGFREGFEALVRAGCSAVYLDGSFVTEKEIPGDFDACWDPDGVDPSKVPEVMFDFANAREAQKERFWGEFFPSTFLADGTNTFLNYFQVEKLTGKPKGILKVCPSPRGRKEGQKS